MIQFAAQMAIAGARAGSASNPILKQLDSLSKQINAQASFVSAWHSEDIVLFREMNDKLNERFAKSLGLPEVPSA